MEKQLGDLLVEHELITEEELQTALKSQKSSRKKRLGKILVESEQVKKRDLLRMLALQLEIPFFDLETVEIDAAAVRLFPENLSLNYGCTPITRENNKLVVVMADPLNLQALDDLVRMTECEIEPAVADREQIEYIIKTYRSAESLAEISESLPELDGLFKVVKMADRENSLDESVTDLKIQSQQAPIVKIVNIVINEAIRERATDIHIEPQANALIVRDRIDGILYEKHHLPKRNTLREASSSQKAATPHRIANQNHGRHGHRREEGPAGRKGKNIGRIPLF